MYLVERRVGYVDRVLNFGMIHETDFGYRFGAAYWATENQILNPMVQKVMKLGRTIESRVAFAQLD